MCIGLYGCKYSLHVVGEPKIPVSIQFYNKGRFPISYSL